MFYGRKPSECSCSETSSLLSRQNSSNFCGSHSLLVATRFISRRTPLLCLLNRFIRTLFCRMKDPFVILRHHLHLGFLSFCQVTCRSLQVHSCSHTTTAPATPGHQLCSGVRIRTAFQGFPRVVPHVDRPGCCENSLKRHRRYEPAFAKWSGHRPELGRHTRRNGYGRGYSEMVQ
jgi:hypothetical protein